MSDEAPSPVERLLINSWELCPKETRAAVLKAITDAFGCEPSVEILASSTDDDLRSAFEAFGEVTSAKVIMDRETGRSRGFGFVEMPNDNEAREAIDGMNQKDLQGRSLRVNEAREREERPRGPRRF